MTVEFKHTMDEAVTFNDGKGRGVVRGLFLDEDNTKRVRVHYFSDTGARMENWFHEEELKPSNSR